MGTKVYDNALDLITFTRASSATYLDSDGLLKTASTNIPRIEYDTSGAVKGLLVEEARTNLVANEYNRTGSPAWSLGGSVTQAQDQLSITGEVSGAWSYNGTGNSSDLLTRGLAAVVADTWYTESKIVKKVSGSDWLMLDMRFPTAASGRILCWFNIGAGVKGSSSVTAGTATAQLLSYDVEDLGSGYYRVWMVVKSTTGTQSGSSLTITTADSSTTPAAGVFINEFWQLEAGQFPTSSIRTSGATATRAADIASIPVSAFGYNQKAGSVVVEWTQSGNNNGAVGAALDDATFNNRIALFTDTVSGGTRTPGLLVTVGGVNQVGLVHPAISANSENTLASAYSTDDFASSLNGAAALTDTAGSLPVVTKMNIGVSGPTTVTYLNGHIRSVSYYPRRLSNAQLQELTT